MMRLKQLMREKSIHRGDVVLYKWVKEGVDRNNPFGPLRSVEYFVGFMVSRVEGGRIYDALGAFPQENVVAVFKPLLRTDKSLLVWKMNEERMCTETLELLINRLLDIFPESYLLSDDGYFEIVRRQSLVHYQLVEVVPELVIQMERDRDRASAQDVMNKFNQMVERRSQAEDLRRRS